MSIRATSVLLEQEKEKCRKVWLVKPIMLMCS